MAETDIRKRAPRVLVADDDWMIRDLASNVLTSMGVEVIEAADGGQALRRFHREKPDLLLLDVLMPELDGFEVCSRIRAEVGSELPILLVTGYPDSAVITRAYESGATDFVTKPLEWVVLGHRIRYVLRASERARDLVRSQEQLAVAQRLARLGSWSWSAAEGAMAWSDELCCIAGFDPAQAEPSWEALMEMVHPLDRQRVRAFLQGPGVDDEGIEHRILRPDGTVRTVKHRVAPRGTVADGASGTMQDVTHELELEKQLARIQRMEALGTLAAGIVHEISNPAGFVSWNLEAMQEELNTILGGGAKDGLEAWEILQASLKDATNGMGRIQKILKDLKSFSHPAEEEWRWMDLRELLESALTISWNELKYHCEVVREYGELPKVCCQPIRLDQVFINLFVNAAHAMRDGGRLTIATRDLGGRVQVAVRDTGEGIEPGIRSRIFEPFFTTKPIGKGTGLGLHVVHGIVKGHGGDIEVRSAPGQGTEFLVTLPVEPQASRVHREAE